MNTPKSKIIKYADGSMDIPFDEFFPRFQLAIDENYVRDLAIRAASRIATLQNRKNGMSWRAARKAAYNTQPSNELLAIVRRIWAHGANEKETIEAAIAKATT